LAVSTPFKEAFCKHCNVPIASYEREVIRRTLRPHAAKVWPLLEMFGAKTVFSSRRLVRMVAETRTRDDLIDVIDEYYKDFKPKAGFLVNVLNISISCRKLVALHDQARCSITE
jgi:hypothetical protein